MPTIRRIPPSALAIAAQGAVSLNSLALAVAVARNTTVVEFAYFSLALPLYAILLRTVRVLFLIPRQIRYRNEDIQGSGRAVTKAATVFSIAGVFPIALFSLALPDNIAPWTLALSLCLPALMLYDSVRNEFLSQKRFWRVLFSDIAWLTTCMALFILNETHQSDLPPQVMFGLWAAPPLIIGLVNYATLPSQGALNQSVKSEFLLAKSRTRDCISDVISSTLSVQALPYILVALASQTLVAGFRGGQTLLGPINAAIMGVTPLLQMSTAKAKNASSVYRTTIKWSALTTVISIVYGSALYLLPDALGTSLLGDTWSITQELLIATTATVAFRAPYLAAVTALRSLGRDNLLVRLRFFSTSTLLLSASLGATYLDSSGAIWAIALSAALSSFLALAILHRLARQIS